MISGEGEVVKLAEPVDPNGANVENWMTALEQQMIVSVKQVLFKSMQDYKTMKRTDWIASTWNVRIKRIPILLDA